MKFDYQIYRTISLKKNLKIGIVKKNKILKIGTSIENVLNEIEKDFKSEHTFIEFDFD